MDKTIRDDYQISTLKKSLKKGKTEIINKYVKKIHHLQNRKGDASKVAKCQRKAKKLQEEVAVLQKIKARDMCKVALGSKDKDWKNVLSQGKAGAAKAATTITTTQQLRQFLIQQQMLKQARKGNKVTANLTQLAKIPGKATGIPASMNAVQIVQHNPQVGGTQQVKGLPTAIGLQQIQQAMKQVIPQNLPVVVTATPSLPGVHSVKAQTTTLPSTTLNTVLKGAPPVGVGQQQTAAILQQVAASIAAGLTPVTLAAASAAPRLSPSILSATDQPSPPTHVVINSVPVAMTTASQANVQKVPLFDHHVHN